MKIVKHNWHWLGSLTKVSTHPGVVWHHADGYGSPESIHNYHQHLKPLTSALPTTTTFV